MLPFCVSIPDDRLGEELGVLFSKTNVSRELIFKALAETFGLNFNSMNFYFIERLPMTSNLKVDREESAKIILENSQ